MSTAILRLYDNADVSYLSDGQLIFSQTFEHSKTMLDEIFSILSPLALKTIKIVVKPVEVKGNALVINSFKVGARKANFGISDKDTSALSSLVTALNVENVEMYTALDYHKTLTSERCLIVDEQVNNNLIVSVFEGEKFLDFSYCRPQSLESVINTLSVKHKTAKVINAGNSLSLSLDMSKLLKNYNSIEVGDKPTLMQSLFSVVIPSTIGLGEASIVAEEEVVIAPATLSSKVKHENKVQMLEDTVNEVLKPSLLEKIKGMLKGKAEDVEHVDPNPPLPIIAKVSSLVLVLFALVLGVQLSLMLKIPQATASMENAIARTESLDFYQAQDTYLDKALTTLRSGEGYHNLVYSNLNKLKFDGKLGSVEFAKDKFTVIVYVKNNDYGDAFVNLLSQQYNVQESLQQGVVQISGKDMLKLAVIAN